MRAFAEYRVYLSHDNTSIFDFRRSERHRERLYAAPFVLIQYKF